MEPKLLFTYEWIIGHQTGDRVKAKCSNVGSRLAELQLLWNWPMQCSAVGMQLIELNECLALANLVAPACCLYGCSTYK